MHIYSVMLRDSEISGDLKIMICVKYELSLNISCKLQNHFGLHKDIYTPILEELHNNGIVFKEKKALFSGYNQ